VFCGVEVVYVMFRVILRCLVVLKSVCDIVWYIKVLCGVEEVYEMLRVILRCFVVLKKCM
jgi:hypothetical protein